MRTYLLVLFYATLGGAAGDVRRLKAEVESIAGRQYRVLGAGEQACAIGFRTGTPPDQWRERIARCKSDSLNFLLVETAEVIDGFLGQDALTWLRNRPTGPAMP